MRGSLIDIVDSFFASLKPSGPAAHWIEAHLGCDPATMYRQGDPDRLLHAGWTTAVQLGLASAGASFVAGGSIGATASAIAGLAYVPIVIARAYQLSPACFLRLPPMLPSALADDLFEVVNSTLLPRNLPWPSGLSPDGWARVPTGAVVRRQDGAPMQLQRLNSTPVDCSADPVGMHDGVRVAAWFLEAHAPGWRSSAPMFTAQTLLGARRTNSYFFYYVDAEAAKAPVYRDCALLQLPNVAVALVAGAAAIAVALILLHLVLFAFRQLINVVVAFNE